MKKFATTLLTGTALSLVLTFAWVCLCMMGERDTLWNVEWLFEISWFFILTVMVIVVAFVLRPGERSKMLVAMQELLDETLTEIDTNSVRNNDFNGMPS